jgi:hypothetical protein
MMTYILAIIGGACLLCTGGVIALCVAASIPAPKPNYSKAQILWMTHTARVAHRRVS